MCRHNRDTHLVFADLDLVNEHSFGKRKQGIVFHHHLISLSTPSHTFLCSAVYHPFFLSLQPHQFPASPKSAKSRLMLGFAESGTRSTLSPDLPETQSTLRLMTDQ